MAIDPLLRGIYYLFLSDDAPDINDLEVMIELASIYRTGGRPFPNIDIWDSRHMFVKELVKRNGYKPQS